MRAEGDAVVDDESFKLAHATKTIDFNEDENRGRKFFASRQEVVSHRFRNSLVFFLSCSIENKRVASVGAGVCESYS